MDNGKRSISPRDLYLWIAVSIFAASFSCGANAQKINWQIFTEPFVTSAHAQEIGKRLTTPLAENRPCRVTCTDMAFRAPISP